MSPRKGVSFCLFGDSGSGKTTQVGELSKEIYRSRKQKTELWTSDMGGYESIMPHVRAGIVIPRPFDMTKDDAWIYTNDAVSGANLSDDIGLVAIDSGSSIAEALLLACHKSPVQIGQQKTQRFTVSSKDNRNLTVSINNEAHYGVVQGYMLDAIWRSMALTNRGIDVLWTFSVHRGEEQDRTPILGPKLAGKALTPHVPKWFTYTIRIASIPREGSAPIHRLYIAEYPELAGLGHSFGNSRVPLGGSPLPPYIEPASIPEMLRLISNSQEEADRQLREELGL